MTLSAEEVKSKCKLGGASGHAVCDKLANHTGPCVAASGTELGFSREAEEKFADAQSLLVLTHIQNVVIDTVREASELSPLRGIPCSTVYLAVQQVWTSLTPTVWENFVGGLVKEGRLLHSQGHLLTVP